jgi:signal transduction histidine kinase/DNA-binding NarL/FixJ family response regulator/HPt (histidine-containing phosphotransfer) domain-containing protein
MQLTDLLSNTPAEKLRDLKLEKSLKEAFGDFFCEIKLSDDRKADADKDCGNDQGQLNLYFSFTAEVNLPSFTVLCRMRPEFMALSDSIRKAMKRFAEEHIALFFCRKQMQQMQVKLRHRNTELGQFRREFIEISGENLNKYQELEASNKSLQREIKERERIEALLIQAREEAERANQAKGEFLACMSHEIRTPMNGILGLSRNLLKTELNDEQKRQLELVYKSGQSLLRIIDDILDLSRLESGKLEIAPSAFDLPALLQEVVSVMEVKAVEKNLRLELLTSGEIPRFVELDEHRLRQILLNLLGNALKFTSVGSVVLTVKKEWDDSRKGERLFFQVEDTGMGIPADKIKKLFQPFSQADAAVARNFGGSGLGLSIVKKLVLAMGGDVSLESTPEKGSRVWFYLPFSCRSSDCLIENTAETENTVLNPGDISILVAEDNEVNREVISLTLRSLGFNDFKLVHDGLAAVAELKENFYDLVLMDIHMDKMGGVEATRMIRAGHGVLNPDIPVVALTASALQHEVRKYIESGMNGCLAKPVHEKELLAVIKKCLLSSYGQSSGSGKSSGGGQSAFSSGLSSAGTEISIFADMEARDIISGEVIQAYPPKIRQTLLKTFRGGLPDYLREVTDSITNESWASLFRVAHQLRGACLNFGAGRVAFLCEKLEELGLEESNLQSAKLIMSELQKQLELLDKALTQAQQE